MFQDDDATAKPRLGVFGSGSFGGRLAALARAAGYEVVVGKRENAFSVAEQSQIFVIGIPFLSCATALPPLAAALEGKIVVDAMNPLKSKVVKAFNTVFADTMTREGLFRDDQRVTAFICGDDVAAKSVVCDFAESLGFASLDAGPLRNCRYTEALAHLNVQLALVQGGGTDAAIVYHRRKKQA